MGCGMGTRKLGRFLAWINGWRKVAKLKIERKQVLEEGVHFACKYGSDRVKEDLKQEMNLRDCIILL